MIDTFHRESGNQDSDESAPYCRTGSSGRHHRAAHEPIHTAVNIGKNWGTRRYMDMSRLGVRPGAISPPDGRNELVVADRKKLPRARGGFPGQKAFDRNRQIHRTLPIAQ